MVAYCCRCCIVWAFSHLTRNLEGREMHLSKNRASNSSKQSMALFVLLYFPFDLMRDGKGERGRKRTLHLSLSLVSRSGGHSVD